MPDNDKFDPRDQFGFRLGRLARFWRARLDEKMRPHGLTQARWVVMVHLRRGGNGFKQKDLADFVGIEGPTLVHILDNLEIVTVKTVDEVLKIALTKELKPIEWIEVENLPKSKSGDKPLAGSTH